MKKFIKYSNFFFFIVSLILLISLQSYTHFSTSLLAVLDKSSEKEMLSVFENTNKSHTLVVAVKGFDEKSLNTMRKLEKELDNLSLISLKRDYVNIGLQSHQKEYKLFIQDVNVSKLSSLDVSLTLQHLYNKMTSSFFPIIIDKIDPMGIFLSGESRDIAMKNMHLILGNYGYMSYFTLHSQNMKTHQNIYNKIHTIMKKYKDIVFFSPLFFYVENSQAIRSDVQNIILIAFLILILLYFVLLKDVLLLMHTFTTLTTSAILAIVLLAQVYEQISIFVFVFGISISTVAIDYMFHHYLHAYYQERQKFNKEVLFGFLTTFFAFLILSFTSFLLIKQIAFFAMLSLFISYIHFAFLYPMIGFKPLQIEKDSKKNILCRLPSKVFLFISLLFILFSSIWIEFDFNLKNLDYDNYTLKKKEEFFKSKSILSENMSFAIKADSIDELITHSKALAHQFPSSVIPLSGLMSKASYAKNKDIFLKYIRVKYELEKEAHKLGFKEEYFKDAYNLNKPFFVYTEEQIKNYGIELIKIDDMYITFGLINKRVYSEILKYDFVQSLSMKEHFEVQMQRSMQLLGFLGAGVIVFIMSILLSIARNKFIYAVVFILFPIAMMSLYGLFFSINILHLFMLFIILAIGIDYAIYMVTDNTMQTKRAISYSLVSTFSGFGVLVFSTINALYSLGVIATIGIVSIFMLLLCMKKEG